MRKGVYEEPFLCHPILEKLATYQNNEYNEKMCQNLTLRLPLALVVSNTTYLCLEPHLVYQAEVQESQESLFLCIKGIL